MGKQWMLLQSNFCVSIYIHNANQLSSWVILMSFIHKKYIKNKRENGIVWQGDTSNK